MSVESDLPKYHTSVRVGEVSSISSRKGLLQESHFFPLKSIGNILKVPPSDPSISRCSRRLKKRFCSRPAGRNPLDLHIDNQNIIYWTPEPRAPPFKLYPIPYTLYLNKWEIFTSGTPCN